MATVTPTSAVPLEQRLERFAAKLRALTARPYTEQIDELVAEFDELRAMIAAAVPGRVLDDPCRECAGPIIVAASRIGRLPRRCDACRSKPPDPGRLRGNQNRASVHAARPAEGMRRCARCREVKPDTDANFQLKDPRTGTRDSFCRPCRGEYAAARYARVGTKIVIVELCEGDDALGASCPSCRQPFAVGERIMGGNLRHVDCKAGLHART